MLVVRDEETGTAGMGARVWCSAGVVSGANAEEAKANRARFEVTLNKKTGAKFCAVEHEDGTYLAVYRVWPIK